MRQPGVNVQPLRQMNYHASFNQVFITDAEVEPELQMGKTGEGWKIVGNPKYIRTVKAAG